MMITQSLFNYGIEKVTFVKQADSDVFGNIIFYQLEKDNVIINTKSFDLVQYLDFDTIVCNVSFCIYNSSKKGYYDPSFIINLDKGNINNEKIRRTSKRTKAFSIWNKTAHGFTKEATEGIPHKV